MSGPHLHLSPAADPARWMEALLGPAPARSLILASLLADGGFATCVSVGLNGLAAEMNLAPRVLAAMTIGHAGQCLDLAGCLPGPQEPGLRVIGRAACRIWADPDSALAGSSPSPWIEVATPEDVLADLAGPAIALIQPDGTDQSWLLERLAGVTGIEAIWLLAAPPAAGKAREIAGRASDAVRVVSGTSGLASTAVRSGGIDTLWLRDSARAGQVEAVLTRADAALVHAGAALETHLPAALLARSLSQGTLVRVADQEAARGHDLEAAAWNSWLSWMTAETGWSDPRPQASIIRMDEPLTGSGFWPLGFGRDRSVRWLGAQQEAVLLHTLVWPGTRTVHISFADVEPRLDTFRIRIFDQGHEIGSLPGPGEIRSVRRIGAGQVCIPRCLVVAATACAVSDEGFRRRSGAVAGISWSRT